MVRFNVLYFFPQGTKWYRYTEQEKKFAPTIDGVHLNKERARIYKEVIEQSLKCCYLHF